MNEVAIVIKNGPGPRKQIVGVYEDPAMANEAAAKAATTVVERHKVIPAEPS